MRNIVWIVLLLTLTLAVSACSETADLPQNNVHASPQATTRQDADGSGDGDGAEPSPSSTAGEDGSDAEGVVELELFIEETEAGFRLQWDASRHPDLFIMGTQQPEIDSRFVVHILRRSVYMNEQQRFLVDAAVVDVEERAVVSFPLIDVVATDSYTLSSFIEEVGFLNQQELVYVRPVDVEDSHQLQYDIAALNILTGSQRTIVENAIPDIAPDFLSAGWMNSAATRFYLSSFDGGQLWMTDLHNEAIHLSETSLISHWPMSNVRPSPDGERIVHFNYDEYRWAFYTAEGKLLALLPEEEGFTANPPVLWSPDSRYGIYQYTLDQGEENGRLSYNESSNTTEPQAVRMLDREGSQLWAVTTASGGIVQARMEWSGWLSGSDYGVIHYYDLEYLDDERIAKINSQFVLVETATGTAKTLQEVNQLHELPAAEAVYGGVNDRAVLADPAARLVWQSSNTSNAGNESYGQFISSLGNNKITWVETDYAIAQTIAYQYDPVSKIINETEIAYNEYPLIMVGENLLLGSGRNYYQQKKD